MPRIRSVLLIGTVFLLAIPLIALSAVAREGNPSAGPTSIEAETIRYMSDPEAYEAEGDVFILFDGGYLKADWVRLEVQTGDAEAEGNVFLQSGGDTIEGSSATLNTVTRRGVIYDGSIFFEEDHFFVRGKTIEKRGDQEYSFYEAEVTSCSGDVPDWKITGRQIDVTIDGYGTIRRGAFNVKDFPILYVPYMVFPAKTTRQSGFLTPRAAYSRDTLGWDVGIPYYWAISESTDATFYQRYMDKRGYQQGVEFRYWLGQDSHGTFYADYLRDGMRVATEPGDGELFRDWREPQDRWSWYVDHETRSDSGLTLRANMKKVSDNWYFRDFDSHNYYLEHYDETEDRSFRRVDFSADRHLSSLDSTLRLTQDWDRFYLTMLGQYRDNFRSHTNESTLQKYPEITLTGLKQPIGNTPFDFELDSTYGYYYRTAGQRGHYFDAAPIVSLPLNVGHYFRFIPEVGVRETRWDSTDTSERRPRPDSRDNRTVYHVGSTLSSEIHRIFTLQRGPFEMLRHSIRPEVTYLYRPYVSQDNRPNYVRLLDEKNSLTYGITNTFTARYTDDEGHVSYRELVDLKVSQTYDIIEARRDKPLTAPDRKKRPFSDIDLELALTPHPFVRIASDATLDAYDGTWRALNSLLRLRNGRGDSATVEYRYTRDLVEQLNLGVQVKATDRVDLFFDHAHDRLAKRSLETIYGLVYNKQCWDIALTYTDSPYDRSYMIILSLRGLGRLAPITGTLPGRD